MRSRMWSACDSSQHFFSNIVLPGTSSTPPVMTRPGSPQACASTAVIMLENRIPKIVTRYVQRGQVRRRGADTRVCRVETRLDPLAMCADTEPDSLTVAALKHEPADTE